MGNSSRKSEPSGDATQSARPNTALVAGRHRSDAGASAQPFVRQGALTLLAKALIREGFGALVEHPLPESAYFEASALRAGVVVTSAILASLLWAMTMLTGVLWGVGLAAAWVVLIYATGQAKEKAVRGLGSTLAVAVVLGVLIWQLIAEGFGSVALSFGVPILVGCVWLVFFQLDFSALERSVPFLFALTLFILLVPLLTDDVWLVASRLTARQFVWVALAFVCPVLVPSALRLRGHVRKLAEDDPSRIGTPDELEKSLRNSLQFQLVQDGIWTEGKVIGADQRWGDQQAEHVEYAVTALRTALAPPRSAAKGNQGGRASGAMPGNIVDGLRRGLLRHLLRRLVTTAIIISVAATCYMYLLANLAIKDHAARTWTQKEIPTINMPLIHLWGGPYVHVAVLLGLAAGGIFLALVLTDERYFDSLARALVGRPGKRAAALLIPYAALTDSGAPGAAGSRESAERGARLG
jgi:hypothetical protein